MLRQGCNETIEHQNLESHLTNDYLLTIVDSDFKCFGCEVRLPRKELFTHFTHITAVIAPYGSKGRKQAAKAASSKAIEKGKQTTEAATNEYYYYFKVKIPTV